MRAVIALLVVGLSACDPRAQVVYRPLCDISTAQQRAEFILTCAKNANPMSDEEGEDLVEQCEQSAENIFCPESPYACYDMNCIPCTKALDGYRKSVCEGAK